MSVEKKRLWINYSISALQQKNHFWLISISINVPGLFYFVRSFFLFIR